MRSAVFFTLLSTAISFAQTPATTQKKGSVSGSVSGANGEPLKNATVHLQGQPTLQAGGPGVGTVTQLPQAFTASSDAQGNFSFEDLDPARYTLFAERTGYLRTNYSNGSLSPLLDLTSGQSLTGLALKMTPQGVIAGTVTNDDGDPVPNARVTLARWGYNGGRRRLLQTAGTTSNFEGAFSAGNLTSGSYVVIVSPQPVNSLANIRQKGSEETYATTYYPGVTDPSAAIAVQVNAGAIVRGTDVRMRKVRSFRIQGKVSGNVAQNTVLRLLPKDASDIALAGGLNMNSVLRDGTFNFAGVIPGAYILEVMPNNVRAADGTMTTTNDLGRQIVNVGNADVTDLVIQLGPGADITGKISTEGPPQQQASAQPPLPGANLQPSVRLMDVNGNSGVPFNAPKADGTFEMHHIMPSVYQVQVAPLPPGLYVKSIRFGSQDLTKSTLDLSSGGGGTIDVVLSPNVADISGVVHGSDGSPAFGVTLTLWTPGVPSSDVLDFTRTARTDANGQFKFADLPPGDYRVAAWEQIDNGLGTVPEFRIKFETKAASVRLNENDHSQIDVTLISRDNIEAEAAKLR